MKFPEKYNPPENKMYSTHRDQISSLMSTVLYLTLLF